MPRVKTKTDVGAERVQMHLRTRFNPIRDLTPQRLSQYLDSFQAGYLREAALVFEKIEQRDDLLASVIPKRKKDAARNGYEIITTEEVKKNARAAKHKEALEFFYGNMAATSATNLNQRGGFKLLVRQMMDCVGKQFAVHETIFKPMTAGLTAEFRFVPLWFFENTTGKLRYLQSDFAIEGKDLEEHGWMVTVGDGLMSASAVAWMFKNLPLKDWLIYCERHGMPIPHGKTAAKKDSEQWDALVDAVAALASESAIVTSEGDVIDMIDMTVAGELPYPKLVERMDRANAAIWRGADLSTMSSGSGDGTGASLQGEETDILAADDAEMISETLNAQIDPFVIKYVCGDDVPLAYVRVKTATQQDVKLDIEVFRFLKELGFPLGKNFISERFSVPQLEADDEALVPPQAPPGLPPPIPSRFGQFANERRGGRGADDAVTGRLIASSRDQLAKAFSTDLKPVRDRLEKVLSFEDPQRRNTELRKLQAELPELLKQVNAQPEAARVLEGAMSAALANGVAEGQQSRS